LQTTVISKSKNVEIIEEACALIKVVDIKII